ncbi:MAG TPA: MAPEG family protein [Myxococcota bacterium]|jgi:uncharacterized MAPEG superfamily protein|nr:MAPEG family protein [Myxococcota bacterium]
MTPSLVALCLFAGWTILLVASLAGYRAYYSSGSGKALNTFAPDGSDVGGLGQRLARAHLNCLELLPVVAAVILAAAVAGRSAVTDPLAMPLLYARLGQSVVHLISISVPMVLLRATLFVVQLGIVASWIYRLVL